MKKNLTVSCLNLSRHSESSAPKTKFFLIVFDSFKYSLKHFFSYEGKISLKSSLRWLLCSLSVVAIFLVIFLILFFNINFKILQCNKDYLKFYQ